MSEEGKAIYQAIRSNINYENYDSVNSPKHYTQGKYETIDVILDTVKYLPGDQGYLLGNILKYLIRYPHKNGEEDLRKARWYINKLIEVYEQ